MLPLAHHGNQLMKRHGHFQQAYHGCHDLIWSRQHVFAGPRGGSVCSILGPGGTPVPATAEQVLPSSQMRLQMHKDRACDTVSPLQAAVGSVATELNDSQLLQTVRPAAERVTGDSAKLSTVIVDAHRSHLLAEQPTPEPSQQHLTVAEQSIESLVQEAIGVPQDSEWYQNVIVPSALAQLRMWALQLMYDTSPDGVIAAEHDHWVKNVSLAHIRPKVKVEFLEVARAVQTHGTQAEKDMYKYVADETPEATLEWYRQFL